MNLSQFARILLLVAIGLTLFSLKRSEQINFKPAAFKDWSKEDLQKMAINHKPQDEAHKLTANELNKMTKSELLAYIQNKNLRLKNRALQGPALVRFLRSHKWQLKEKVTRRLAQAEKRQKIPFSFLHDGIEFGQNEKLYLGDAKVESAYYVIPETSELFINSGDEDAFELFDVTGFVEKTKNGFVIKITSPFG